MKHSYFNSYFNRALCRTRRFFHLWGKLLGITSMLALTHSAYATNAGTVIQGFTSDFTDLKSMLVAAASAIGIGIIMAGCYFLHASHKGHATKVGTGYALLMIVAGGAMTVVTTIAAIAGSTATAGS